MIMARLLASGVVFLAVSVVSAGHAGQAGAWREEKSTHFIVYYNNAPEDFIRKLVENAEYDYDKIAGDLGFNRKDFWLWDERAEVYVYDNADAYHSDTGQPAWTGGDALPGRKIIRTYVYAQGFTETTLPHELSHIIFREFVGFYNPAVPRWLDEGVAQYQEKGRVAGAKPLIQSAMNNGSFIPLSELENLGPQLMFSEAAAGLFYAESAGIVDFLIGEYGPDAFVTFCQNLRDKKNLQRAVSSAYPFSTIVEFNAAWEKYIKK